MASCHCHEIPANFLQKWCVQGSLFTWARREGVGLLGHRGAALLAVLPLLGSLLLSLGGRGGEHAPPVLVALKIVGAQRKHVPEGFRGILELCAQAVHLEPTRSSPLCAVMAAR